jgi:hypothetical protein
MKIFVLFIRSSIAINGAVFYKIDEKYKWQGSRI